MFIHNIRFYSKNMQKIVTLQIFENQRVYI